MTLHPSMHWDPHPVLHWAACCSHSTPSDVHGGFGHRHDVPAGSLGDQTAGVALGSASHPDPSSFQVWDAIEGTLRSSNDESQSGITALVFLNNR